ncbi:hypothetical protein Athai_36210 [Actinocatenispora thailandica]|uniref:Uncharacterized protein n=1 Tax=Actinocatenispora thailandica TaxID=227318 RepID=A0A7R7DQS0_9ACTN|nr:hypothetical protein [Actinocatenispora thailandica]BCJ36118.1 hypothetical protein Athai_36210 [Actinocatenispora thailandica]
MRLLLDRRATVARAPTPEPPAAGELLPPAPRRALDDGGTNRRFRLAAGCLVVGAIAVLGAVLIGMLGGAVGAAPTLAGVAVSAFGAVVKLSAPRR